MAITLKGLIIASILSAIPHTALAGEGQPMIGETAPLFTLKGLDGKKYFLKEARGKYVVIHFATTWCPFCNAEAPHLDQLAKDYKKQGVQVFLVDVKEDRNLVEKWSTRYNFSFPVLLDVDGAVSARYAPEGVQPDLARDEVPLASNLIIDKEGKIRFYSLLNTAAFDAKLSAVRKTLDTLLKSNKSL